MRFKLLNRIIYTLITTVLLIIIPPYQVINATVHEHNFSLAGGLNYIQRYNQSYPGTGLNFTYHKGIKHGFSNKPSHQLYMGAEYFMHQTNNIINANPKYAPTNNVGFPLTTKANIAHYGLGAHAKFMFGKVIHFSIENGFGLLVEHRNKRQEFFSGQLSNNSSSNQNSNQSNALYIKPYTKTSLYFKPGLAIEKRIFDKFSAGLQTQILIYDANFRSNITFQLKLGYYFF